MKQILFAILIGASSWGFANQEAFEIEEVQVDSEKSVAPRVGRQTETVENSQGESSFRFSQIQRIQMQRPEGFIPFIVLGLGYMDRSDRYETEGVPLQMKLMGSYYSPNYFLVGDLGLGIDHQSYSQDQNGRSTTQAVLEAAGRYEFAERLSAGVVFNLLSGEGDKIGSNSENAFFWGLQLVKEFPLKSWNVESLARVGARISTDVNIPGERVNVFMLEASMGFPNFERRDPTVVKSYRPVSQPAPQLIVLSQLLKDPSNTQFGLNSADLNQGQASYLDRLAQALQNNPGLVREIYVVGHADESGSQRLNMQLSKKRAEEVARRLRQAGLSQVDIKVDWKGSSLPVNRVNLEENRRVEVRFLGVRDDHQLNQLLRAL